MSERLTPERLSEIRERATAWVCTMDDPSDLLAHIDAQQAELLQAESQVAAWRKQWETAADDIARFIPGFDRDGYVAEVLAAVEGRR